MDGGKGMGDGKGERWEGGGMRGEGGGDERGGGGGMRGEDGNCELCRNGADLSIDLKFKRKFLAVGIIGKENKKTRILVISSSKQNLGVVLYPTFRCWVLTRASPSRPVFFQNSCKGLTPERPERPYSNVVLQPPPPPPPPRLVR